MKRLDLAVADALHDAVGGQRWLLDALRALDVVLHPWVFRVAVLVLVVVLVRRGSWRLAWWAAITMTTGSLLGLVLKLVVARARPSFDLPLATAPGYSFPSGHTLHAVAFTVVALGYYPWLAALLIPFTASVAVSRVVLGLHYPSDVLAATAIGSALAGVSLALGTLLS